MSRRFWYSPCLAGAMLVCYAGLAYGQATDITLTSAGGSYTIKAGSYTGSPTALSGSADFLCNGVLGDYATRDMWAYRVTGDTREYMATDSYAGAATTITPTGTTCDISMFKWVNNSHAGSPDIRIDIHYLLGANSPTSPVLFRCMMITNLSATNTINFSMFHYEDYDIPSLSGSAGDFVSSNTPTPTSDLVQLHDSATPGNYAESYFAGTGGLVSYQHGPVYPTFFTDSGINNMNDTDWVGGAAGDLAMGFQFDGTLLPGETSICVGDWTALNGSAVPEPASVVAMVLGVVALGWRRRTALPGSY